VESDKEPSLAWETEAMVTEKLSRDNLPAEPRPRPDAALRHLGPGRKERAELLSNFCSTSVHQTLIHIIPINKKIAAHPTLPQRIKRIK
jgi:hypothetical protein